MLLLLVLLVQWRVTACTALPTLEDNRIPTAEEAFSNLINSYRGQPEQEIALNLPTDEDALNEIKPILQSGNPFHYIGSTGRFISSSFPEIDSRGFHESVFDDLDDLYPISRRGKRHDSSMMVDPNIFTNGFGLAYSGEKFHKSRKNALPSSTSYHSRWKRSALRAKSFPESEEAVTAVLADDYRFRGHSNNTIGIEEFELLHNGTLNHTLNSKNETNKEIRQKRAVSKSNVRNFPENPKPEVAVNDLPSDEFSVLEDFEPMNTRSFETNLYTLDNLNEIDWNNELNPEAFRREPISNVVGKRVPEIDKGGFHGDVFHNNFGNFHTLKRAPDMGQSGFHGDIFHKSFGDFNTLKRAPEMSQIGFHNDVFHNSFGNFETLRKRKPVVDTKNFNHDAFNRDFGHFDTLRKRKRKPGNTSTKDDFETGLFDRDTGNFYPGKRRPNAGAVNGDAFHSNFGIFETLKKRRPEGELIGDAFHRGFGNFDTMKRGNGFYSNFETMKSNAYASGLDNDIFHNQFDNFDTVKRSTTSRLAPTSQGAFNNYVESVNKIRPQRFDKLQYFFRMQPQNEINYEKFRTFFRNYALLNKFDDMTKRLRASTSSLNFLKNNSSHTH